MSGPAPSAYVVDPFGPSANPAAYVPCAASERARATLERSLDEGRVAALVGPPGLGKTLILHLVQARQAERSLVVYVPFCDLEPDEFFALVLNLLGERAPDTGSTLRGKLLALARARADRGGVLVLVDDAAALPSTTAEALADLVLAAEGALRLALAAVEGPEARRVCGAFGTRLDVVRLSEGMSEREARRYVEIRLAYAGARPDLVAAFDDETIAELHRESDGVPRRLNQQAHELVRRVAPGGLPRLSEALERMAEAEPSEPVAPEPPPLLLPPSEPPPRALHERDAYRETGAYRMVRGRPVGPDAEPPAAPAASPSPTRHAAETPDEVFARLKRAASPPGEADAAPPEGRGAGLAPEAAAPQAMPARRRRRSLLLAGAATFAFAAALAFAWSSGHLPAELPLPPPELVEEIAEQMTGLAEREPPAAPRVPGPEATAPATGPVAEPVAPEEPAQRSAFAAPPPEPAVAASPAAVASPEREPASPADAESVAPEPALVRAPEPGPVDAAAPEPGASGAAAVPEPPAPEPEPVPVAINAIPWAVVEVDGRELGETPLAGIRLAPGPHTFRARMPDGTLRERTVEITPDRRRVVFE